MNNASSENNVNMKLVMIIQMCFSEIFLDRLCPIRGPVEGIVRPGKRFLTVFVQHNDNLSLIL